MPKLIVSNDKAKVELSSATIDETNKTSIDMMSFSIADVRAALERIQAHISVD